MRNRIGIGAIGGNRDVHRYGTSAIGSHTARISNGGVPYTR